MGRDRDIEDPNELIAKQHEQRKRRRVGGSKAEESSEEGKTQARQNGEIIITGKPENGKTGELQQGRKVELEDRETAEPQNVVTEERDTRETGEIQPAIPESTQDVIAAEPQILSSTESSQAQITVKRDDDKVVEPQEDIKVEHLSAKEGIMQQGIELEKENDKTEFTQNSEAGSQGSGETGEQQSGNVVVNEEKATEKITLYLSWRQLDKLDEMVRGYKRRMRKRTDQNKLMRMMIDKFTLDDLLS